MTALNYYHIRVIVIAMFLCAAQTNLQAQLKTDFSATPASGCQPMVIQFNDLSAGNPTQWRWDLGNGVVSTLKNPSATYFSPGTYSVKLVIKNGQGADSLTKHNFITVHPNPVVDFSVSDSTGCFPLPVKFTNRTTTATGNITKYSWDFGDGTTSEQINPTHIYTSAGNFTVTLRVTNSFGCVQTISKSQLIKTSTGVKSTFTHQSPGVCTSPVAIQFTNTSTGPGTLNYQWNFGDGNSSTQKDPSHTYQQAGIYTVSLITTSNQGCRDTVVKQNLVSIGQIKSDFTTGNNLCQGAAIQFTNTSSPLPGSSIWYFGDGTTATSLHPKKTYTNPGTYQVKLVNDFGGCKDSITHTIQVLGKPAAAFSADKTTGCQVPFAVKFTSTSTGAQQYAWNFGDGNTSTQANPTHTFTKTGNYTVRLVVTNSNGCTDTLTRTQYIRIQEPVIVLNNLPAQGCVPVTIKPVASIQSNDAVTSYAWNFGDGGTSSSMQPTYTYQQAGTYDVSLTITTASGCTKTVVYPQAVKAGNKPDADFEVRPTDVCAFQPVSFTDLSKGDVDQWLWDFGDGTNSIAQNPVHEYQDTGWFSVRLITWNNTCADTIVYENIVHIKPPIASFNYVQSCDDQASIQFNDRSIGAETVQWFFGDGQSSTDRNPYHQYNGPGIYEVVLNVTNGTCTHSTRQQVRVMNEQANFKADATEICKGSTINFSSVGIDNNNIAIWSWDFGDGRTASSVGTTSHQYNNAGQYRVKLLITDLLGCTDTSSLLVTVYGPVADFEPGISGACLGQTSIPFTDLSKTDGQHGLVKWVWNFGDGTLDSTPATPVSHFYNEAGEYQVSLTVTDAFGCSNTAVKNKSVIIAQPKAEFLSIDTTSCTDKNIRFQNGSAGYDLQYQWNFGDGQSSAQQHPIHQYAQVGSYDIRLTVTDKYGCVATTDKPSYINISYPKALFTASDTLSSCPPLLVNFTNQSTDFTALSWDFGDGNTSTLPNPSHYYTEPGIYFATLTASGPGGCTSIHSQRIEVRGPRGSFTYQPPVGCNPLTVNFVATTHDRSSFIWDFSDGNTLATKDSIVSHTYKVPGSYVPKMILIDASGCTVPIVGKDTIHVMDVEASISMDKNVLCDNGMVNFSSIVETNDRIAGYAWNFGDGHTSTLPQPSHHYASPGVYDISLRITTEAGCSQEVLLKDTIRIFPAPIISMSSDTAACLPAIVSFDPKVERGSAGALQWHWNFGNGNTHNGHQPPQITYEQAGTYQVVVNVTDDKGCSDTVTNTIIAHPLPVVEAGNDAVVCLGDSIQLKPAGAATYTWNQNSDLSCIECPQPFAKPTINTTYIVTGKTGFGCEATDSVFIRVRLPFTLAVGPGDSICVGESYQLSAGGADQYIWLPSTGLNKTNIADPVARPVQSTTYQVIASDNDQCFSDTATVRVHVTPLPQVEIGDDVVMPVGSSHQFKPVYSADVSSYRWSPAGTLNCTTCPEPFAQPKENTRYFVEVKNDGGCVSMDHVTVNLVCNNGNLFIPNSFSPNKDGANDIFYPRGTGVYMIKALRVFNRWGELVFEKLNFNANDKSAGWDGTYKGKELSPDVYVYACEIVCDNNQVLVFKGDISLLK